MFFFSRILNPTSLQFVSHVKSPPCALIENDQERKENDVHSTVDHHGLNKIDVHKLLICNMTNSTALIYWYWTLTYDYSSYFDQPCYFCYILKRAYGPSDFYLYLIIEFLNFAWKTYLYYTILNTGFLIFYQGNPCWNDSRGSYRIALSHVATFTFNVRIAYGFNYFKRNT